MSASQKPERPQLRSFAIEVTARCNQRCSYCYNSWRDSGGVEKGALETDELITLLDKLIDQATLKYLTLTGGEPFFRKDIHQIIDHINSRGLGVVIISNGGLIDREAAQRLATQRIHYIQITLAGHRADIHERHCGSNTFDKAISAIRHLADASIRVGGSFLCTAHNFDSAADVFRLFSELGVKRVAFNRFNPAGFSISTLLSLMPTRSQIIHALTHVNESAKALDMAVTNTMPIPTCVLDKRSFPNIKFGSCSAGTPHAEYAVGPDGCVRLCTVQKRSIGSLFDSDLTDILADSWPLEFRHQIPDFCEPCPLARTCLGGCSAAAEWAFGTARELDPFIAQHVMPDFEQRLDAVAAKK